MEFLINFKGFNKSNTGIILCDHKRKINKLSYKYVWSLSKEIQTFLLSNIQEENVCVGLFYEKSITLPSVITALHYLKHTFTFLTKSNFTNLSTHLQIKWILSNKNSDGHSSYSVKHILHLSSGDVLFLWGLNTINGNSSNLSFKDIFCVVQTSGTTGKSKIIRVTNQCIENNVLSLRDIFSINSTDVIFWGTPLTFDPSLIELLLALNTKASILVVSKKVSTNPNYLFDAIFKIGEVTFLQIVPSVFFRWDGSQIRNVLESSSLRTLAFGGEKFPKSILKFNRKSDLRLFNLYGVTELSCWATVYEIKAENFDSDVPLGREIGDTVISVMDRSGRELRIGNGEIFLGSKSRICLIDNECGSEEKIGNFSLIATGDLAEINENGIFYIGRINNVNKRFGHKVNLSCIERKITDLTSLENKCVYSEDISKIMCFILSENHEQLSHNFKTRMLDKIRVRLLHSISEESLPDFFELLPTFPLTSHGKIDEKSLVKYYQDSLQKNSDNGKGFQEIFLNIWCKYFGISFYKNPEEIKSFTFFEMGGTSILATQFLTEFKEKCNITDCPKNLVTLLFEDNLDACLKCLENLEGFSKRKFDTEMNNVEDIIESKKLNKNVLEPLKVKWKYDLKACVDSPALVFEKNNATFIAIGGFSNIFVILTDTGEEYLKITLPNATESQPATSPCKNYVLIGCLNGVMYCIDFLKKTVKWEYVTGDKIKSTPCFCDGVLENVVVFGSYDKQVYCVSITNGKLIWKTQVYGSIATNPVYRNSQRKIFIATLKGYFYCLSEEKGDVLWKHNCDVPIFGSPCIFSETNGFESSIIWPDVQGNLHSFNINGHKNWETNVSGHIFSSLVAFDNEKLYFGSRDNYLYEIDKTGKVVKKLLLNSEMSSKPFIYSQKNDRNCEQFFLVAVCNSGYLYVVNLEKFEVLRVFKMPAEVFSSPIVFGNKVYVGCRDNYLYCIDLDEDIDK